MKDKTKKIVAGVVLGTFVFGATIPALSASLPFSERKYYYGYSNFSDYFIHAD